jgi:hypothetical protein
LTLGRCRAEIVASEQLKGMAGVGRSQQVDGCSRHGGRHPPPADRDHRGIARRWLWLGSCSAFVQRRTNMPTESNHQEFETIDSAELSNATGGTAKDTVAKVSKGVEAVLPSVENAAMAIAGVIDG